MICVCVVINSSLPLGIIPEKKSCLIYCYTTYTAIEGKVDRKIMCIERFEGKAIKIAKKLICILG